MGRSEGPVHEASPHEYVTLHRLTKAGCLRDTCVRKFDPEERVLFTNNAAVGGGHRYLSVK